MLEKEDSAYVRSGIAEILGEIGDHRAVKPLLNLIYTNEISVLQSVAQMAMEKIIDK